jgi:hypothetical protein
MRPILGRAALLLASIAVATGCATRPPKRTFATPEQSAEFLRRWEVYRSSALARPSSELFYDAHARRSVFSETFAAAVQDDPGRSLSVVVEGPLGLPLARARWNGGETVIERPGKSPAEKRIPMGAPLSDFGIPLSAQSLSLLLYGLPEITPPEKVERAGANAWFSWNDDRLSCEFDLEAGRAKRVVSRDAKRGVEIRFLAWRGGIPSHIRIDVSTGGSADLVLKSAEADTP